MSNEEAIIIIGSIPVPATEVKRIEALTMAIKALQQQPCEDLEREYEKNKALFSRMVADKDCISREALLSKLSACYDEKIKIAPDNMAEGFMQVEKLIKQEPSIQPARAKGKWIKIPYSGTDSIVDEVPKCSVCNEEFLNIELYFDANSYPNCCPNCGAEMEEW